MTHDYKEPIELINEGYISISSTGNTTNDKRILATILHALTLADKAQFQQIENTKKYLLYANGRLGLPFNTEQKAEEYAERFVTDGFDIHIEEVVQ